MMMMMMGWVLGVWRLSTPAHTPNNSSPIVSGPPPSLIAQPPILQKHTRQTPPPTHTPHCPSPSTQKQTSPDTPPPPTKKSSKAPTREQGPQRVHLGHDRAHGEHVDGGGIGAGAQQHLGGAVPAQVGGWAVRMGGADGWCGWVVRMGGRCGWVAGCGWVGTRWCG